MWEKSLLVNIGSFLEYDKLLKYQTNGLICTCFVGRYEFKAYIKQNWLWKHNQIFRQNWLKNIIS
jgi:hypothetical protein